MFEGLHPSFIGLVGILAAASLGILLQVRGKAQRLRASAVSDAKVEAFARRWIDHDDFVRRRVEDGIRRSVTSDARTDFFVNNTSVTVDEVDSLVDGISCMGRARRAERVRRGSLLLIPAVPLFALLAWVAPAVQWVGGVLLGIVIAGIALLALSA